MRTCESEFGVDIEFYLGGNCSGMGGVGVCDMSAI